MGGGGCGRGRGDFREGEGQKLEKGAEEVVEGNGLTAPSPAPSEAVRVGRLGVEAGAKLASSGNQRAREGHRRRQWDCVSVGEYVCTLQGGGRRVREKEEGGRQHRSSRRSICEGRSRPRLGGTENKGPAEISASEGLRRAERGSGVH